MRISDWSSVVCSSDLELLRRADARGPLGSLRDRLARPIHFDQLATDQLILEPASFLVTRMQIGGRAFDRHALPRDRSEEHTSELQSLMRISYAVFCLKKKKLISKQNSNNKQDQKTTNSRADIRNPTHNST